MPNAFLLRFQEFCVESITAGVQCGTKTDTRVRGEQSDNDAVAADHAALPPASGAAGTMTKTSVERETGGQDQDRCEAAMRAIPGSGTRTKVKREQPDHAPGEAASLVLPSLLNTPMAQTKTVTAVRAEADDNDPKRAILHAIPKCS